MQPDWRDTLAANQRFHHIWVWGFGQVVALGFLEFLVFGVLRSVPLQNRGDLLRFAFLGRSANCSSKCLGNCWSSQFWLFASRKRHPGPAHPVPGVIVE